MTLSASTVWEVETGGDDTNNGGAFDPSQTAGMNADGAATVATTAAPIFTSASYNFVAGDVGAWVYIASGANWTAGWYQIASVTANAATLDAAVGHAVLAAGVPSTVVGCATVAAPTGATWAIDYSQQAAARYAYTDLASVGAGLLVSSVAHPFSAEQVGNGIVITGGTNFTAGTYVIASVAAGVATVVGAGNITSGIGAAGTGGQGGALASPGMAAGAVVAGNDVWIKSGTYTISSTTANISGGRINLTVGGVDDTNVMRWEGYQTTRGDLGTKPVLQVAASGVTNITIFLCNAQRIYVDNLTFDGQGKSTITGFSNGGKIVRPIRCLAQSCTNTGFLITNGVTFYCRATACSTAGAGFNLNNSKAIGCVAHTNSRFGFVGGAGCVFADCLSYGNTGATGEGFYMTNELVTFLNCTAYGNSQNGFNVDGTAVLVATLINCLSTGNSLYGYATAGIQDSLQMLNCAGYNNTSGDYNAANIVNIGNFQALTADPFTNAAGGDFSLNNTAGGGKACRAAGIPGAFPGGLTTGYADIGAVQHADPPAGAGVWWYLP